MRTHARRIHARIHHKHSHLHQKLIHANDTNKHRHLHPPHPHPATATSNSTTRRPLSLDAEAEEEDIDTTADSDVDASDDEYADDADADYEESEVEESEGDEEVHDDQSDHSGHHEAHSSQSHQQHTSTDSHTSHSEHEHSASSQKTSEDIGESSSSTPSGGNDAQASENDPVAGTIRAATSSGERYQMFRGVPGGVIQGVNVTHLSFMIFKIIKQYKIRSIVDIPCRNNIGWFPDLLHRIDFEIVGFKYYCVETDQEPQGDLSKHFSESGSPEFLRIPVEDAKKLPKTDLMFTWDGPQDWGVRKTWTFLSALRQVRPKYILITNNPEAFNVNNGQGAINLRKQPFHVSYIAILLHLSFHSSQLLVPCFTLSVLSNDILTIFVIWSFSSWRFATCFSSMKQCEYFQTCIQVILLSNNFSSTKWMIFGRDSKKYSLYCI